MHFEKNLKKYLSKRSEKFWSFNKKPNFKKYDFFIIVPSKAEKNYLPKLIRSISTQQKKYLEKTLVIIVINNSENENKQIINNNEETQKYLNRSDFKFEIVYIDAFSNKNALPSKKAGVGLARKIGADLALKHSKKSSIMCYTDADVILSKNYLKVINHYYEKNMCGCAIAGFKHQDNIDSKITKNIRKYENFLYITAKKIKQAGSPYGYVSLGSCITCTSNSYISVGGMNSKKATEDFYFLQELTKHFQFMHVINKKIVYPSSRLSDRVYLGTGYRMNKALNEQKIKEIYFSDESFVKLNKLLSIIKESNRLNINELLDKTKDIGKLNKFLELHGIKKIWKSLVKNTDYDKFISQFNRWFDGLLTIKFLKYFS
ncbi:MAG: hypothetical protein CMG00_08910 [Candidatus Marinimicrobia bacterium]|nr:hypothetical protein [Candidatus Neomarinimicrobiota bacterium]|tara:strand:+ start:15089 stop:16210 length:1122 start_codon:yes stop_codon:yes gene_type:complete